MLFRAIRGTIALATDLKCLSIEMAERADKMRQKKRSGKKSSNGGGGGGGE